MCSAMRSFNDPPGFCCSSLHKMVAVSGTPNVMTGFIMTSGHAETMGSIGAAIPCLDSMGTALSIRISGVSPMVLR